MKYEKIDGRFVLPNQRSGATFSDLLRWRRESRRAQWPGLVANKAYPPPPERVEGDRIAATWIGHSTVLLQTAGLNILTDPFFSRRASPSQLFGPARVREPGIPLVGLPPIDLILLSHSHYDHLDKPSLRRLAETHGAILVTPLNNGRHAPGFNAVELDWYQTYGYGPLKITVLPALHWSRRTLRDANRSLWGAFAVEGPMGLIYFAGDTGFGTGETFSEVRVRFGPPRLSLLPIGAYEPRWFMAPQHINPEEAVKAHMLLASETSLAIHHGTIQLTDEAFDAPTLALAEALAGQAVAPRNFLVPDIGETVWIG